MMTTSIPPPPFHPTQGPRSHCEETYPVYRSGCWVQLPALVLVEDDLVALAAGDEAPATVVELDGGGGVGNDDGDEQHGQGGQLRRGSRVAFRPWARADFRHRSAPAADSPKLLRLAGDLRCFRVVEAPLRAFLHKAVGEADEEPLSPSLFAKDMAVVESVALAVMLAMIAALIVLGQWAQKRNHAGASASTTLTLSPNTHHTAPHHTTASLRFTWQDREWRHGAWADYILTEPARLALLALPASRPLLLLLVEALGTARLLVVLEALERGTGRAPREDPATRPELDVEQRLSLRSVPPRVSRRRFLRYAAAVLRARLFGGLAPGVGGGGGKGGAPRSAAAAAAVPAASTSQGGQQQHVVLEMADMMAPHDDEQESDHEQEQEWERLTGRGRGHGRRWGSERVHKVRAGPLLPIPMSRSGALQRLGGVTFLSVMNDELVCRDAPIPQEVLFLNERKGKGGKENADPDPNNGGAVVSATVLRLAPDASAPSGLKFEHPQWVKHMAQLKVRPSAAWSMFVWWCDTHMTPLFQSATIFSYTTPTAHRPQLPRRPGAPRRPPQQPPHQARPRRRRRCTWHGGGAGDPRAAGATRAGPPRGGAGDRLLRRGRGALSRAGAGARPLPVRRRRAGRARRGGRGRARAEPRGAPGPGRAAAAPDGGGRGGRAPARGHAPAALAGRALGGAALVPGVLRRGHALAAHARRAGAHPRDVLPPLGDGRPQRDGAVLHAGAARVAEPASGARRVDGRGIGSGGGGGAGSHLCTWWGELNGWWKALKFTDIRLPRFSLP